jgi:hypothetical protein
MFSVVGKAKVWKLKKEVTKVKEEAPNLWLTIRWMDILIMRPIKNLLHKVLSTLFQHFSHTICLSKFLSKVVPMGSDSRLIVDITSVLKH